MSAVRGQQTTDNRRVLMSSGVGFGWSGEEGSESPKSVIMPQIHEATPVELVRADRFAHVSLKGFEMLELKRLPMNPRT